MFLRGGAPAQKEPLSSCKDPKPGNYKTRFPPPYETYTPKRGLSESPIQDMNGQARGFERSIKSSRVRSVTGYIEWQTNCSEPLVLVIIAFPSLESTAQKLLSMCLSLLALSLYIRFYYLLLSLFVLMSILILHRSTSKNRKRAKRGLQTSSCTRPLSDALLQFILGAPSSHHNNSLSGSTQHLSTSTIYYTNAMNVLPFNMQIYYLALGELFLYTLTSGFCSHGCSGGGCRPPRACSRSQSYTTVCILCSLN